MSLRYAVLGLLARRPSTGYELTQTFDRSLRTSWHARHSQIYPELAKLEAADLVEVVGHGARRSKTYAITRRPGAPSSVAGWSRPSLTGPSATRAAYVCSSPRCWTQPTGEPPTSATSPTSSTSSARSRSCEAACETAPAPEVFAPQVELGIRINGVLRDWLRRAAQHPDGGPAEPAEPRDLAHAVPGGTQRRSGACRPRRGATTRTYRVHVSGSSPI